MRYWYFLLLQAQVDKFGFALGMCVGTEPKIINHAGGCQCGSHRHSITRAAVHGGTRASTASTPGVPVMLVLLHPCARAVDVAGALHDFEVGLGLA